MNWPDTDGFEEPAGGDLEDGSSRRWPLDWRGLYPRERWRWFEQLWCDVCALRDRYRLPVGSGWWEHRCRSRRSPRWPPGVHRYDCGEWDDRPGKLALLCDLERVATLLSHGSDAFHPDRDQLVFARYLVEISCQPPPDAQARRPARR